MARGDGFASGVDCLVRWWTKVEPVTFSDYEAVMEAVAARFCVGNRHQGFVGNCPVCLARYIRLHALFYGPDEVPHDDRHAEGGGYAVPGSPSPPVND